MLIACHTCARQYDVTGLEPGQRIRCACGELNEIPEPRTREAPMQRCASCGGELQGDEQQCGYCDAGVTIQEKGWGETCPACYARLIKDAKFCSACGTAIQPQVVRKSDTSETCPRCEGEMVVCEIPGGHFTECTRCGGVWLEEGAFESLTTQQEQHTAVGSYFSTPDRVNAATEAPKVNDVRYLSCPGCGNLMNRKNFAKCSGVIIDWCRGHGYWFDAHELERIMAFVAKGGLAKSRRREIEEEKRNVKLAKEKARRAQAEMARAHGGSPMMMGGGFHSGSSSLLGAVLGGLLGGLFD